MLMRTFVALGLTVSMGSSLGPCSKKDEGGADAAPAASASAVASAKPKELTFEEKVAASKPLEPKPVPQEGGGVKLTAERCQMDGPAWLDKSTIDVMKSLRVIGDKLYVADPVGGVHAYVIAAGPTCKLTVDKSFGTDGVLKLGEKAEHLGADTAGHLFVSNGFGKSFRLTGGKTDWTCDAKPQGTLYVNPNGKIGIGTFANANVGKLTLDDKGCKSEPFGFTDMNDAAKRKGPFSLAQAAGFVGDLILVGGSLAKDVSPDGGNVVVAVDATGKEKFRFGKIDKAFTEDRFGWVHAIGPCKPGICVLDSNHRRITFWKTDGTYLGFVKLSTMFDLNYPWLSDFSAGKNGATYFTAGQERQRSGASEGNIYRVMGLN